MIHDAERPLLVGVDVGGTKVGVLVVDARSQVRARVVMPTVLDHPDATLAGIAAAIRQAVQAAGADLSAVAAIGMGVPGQVDPQTGVVRHAVNLKWQELPAGPRLAAALGMPCFLANDVRLAAIGLQRHPSYVLTRNLAYVSVGTGIAAGLILDGRLYSGAHNMAGEIGHLVLNPAGPLCVCGLRGCLETLAAGPAIAAAGRQAAAADPTGLLGAADDVTTATVYAAAAAGDPTAQAILRRAGRYLARACQAIMMTYDVERIVFGGGVAAAGEAFLHPIQQALGQMRRQSALARTLLPPDLLQLVPAGYDAGPWGAITLAGQSLLTSTQAGVER
ncbi:MAG: ROK family protein [Chloroflexota bacterium]|nr:ROK family protein [Chloroflexota bacterium]